MFLPLPWAHKASSPSKKNSMEDCEEQSTAVPFLDRDVFFDIFSGFAVKPLLQLRSISKPFRCLIQDPIFVKAHLAKTINTPRTQIFIYYESYVSGRYFSIFNLDADSKAFFLEKKLELPFNSEKGFLRIVGSRNGLICFFDTDYYSLSGNLLLWNPLLQRFKVLPDLDLSFRAYSHMAVGFAYVPEINDFKTLRILYNLNDSNWQISTSAFVYTLAGNCWREIYSVVPCYIPENWSENVFANRSVHWLACNGPDSTRFMEKIMFFDVRREVFGVFGLPDNIGHVFNRLSTSCLENNTLSLFSLSDDKKWGIWLMKEYGMVESWVRMYSGDSTLFSYPVRFIDDNKILCALSSVKLVFSNLKEEPEYENTGIFGAQSSFYAVDYIETLALLFLVFSCKR